jgi:hypothetical protein
MAYRSEHYSADRAKRICSRDKGNAKRALKLGRFLRREFVSQRVCSAGHANRPPARNYGCQSVDPPILFERLTQLLPGVPGSSAIRAELQKGAGIVKTA